MSGRHDILPLSFGDERLKIFGTVDAQNLELRLGSGGLHMNIAVIEQGC